MVDLISTEGRTDGTAELWMHINEAREVLTVTGVFTHSCASIADAHDRTAKTPLAVGLERPGG